MLAIDRRRRCDNAREERLCLVLELDWNVEFAEIPEIASWDDGWSCPFANQAPEEVLMEQTPQADAHSSSQPVDPPMIPNRTRDPAYAWFVVGLLTLAYVFSFIDRQILNLMVGPIQKDLGIDDSPDGPADGSQLRRVLHVLRHSPGASGRYAKPSTSHRLRHRSLEPDDRRLRADQEVLAARPHAHGRGSR